MAATQEAEIIFAQKLASNEKPVRSKALLKLRKYISARSGRAEGGFGEDELLKVWKGLFYCMWMQDMPLLQEELSTKISRLIHNFQTVDSQFLYFRTFLQTMKREWNGIDRLRMDKFYQLVRFVFREVFEMMKRRQWESSMVSEFLQLFSAQLLQSSSAAPAGLILHVFDLYGTELARVGSAQLTAEQNLSFIEPFCKAMAKTKDRVLLKAIGSNVFNTIVDQVPFAIEDLLREIRQSEREELDASDGSENQQDDNELKTKSRSKKKSDGAQDNDSEDDFEEDEPSLPDDMENKEYACGPVLQFDYGAIADKLFEVASRSNIPSFNRSKIYKFVKIFRDLSEGLFPQDKVEDVSADEDDFDDNKRKKKKKKPTNKRKKEQEKSKGQSETSADPDASEDNKQNNKKGKKKKRKNGNLKSVDGETDTQTSVESSDPPDTEKTAMGLTQSNAELSGRDDEIKPDKQLNGLQLLKKKRRRRKRKIAATSEAAADGSTSAEIAASAPLKKKLKDTDGETELTSAEVTEHQDSPQTISLKASRKTLLKKKKRKDAVVNVPEPSANGEAHLEVESAHTEDSQPDADVTLGNVRAKKRKMKSAQLKPERKKRVKVNGLAGETSGKRPKIIAEAIDVSPVGTERKIKPKQFVLRQKKPPAPIFCKAAGYMLSKKALSTPKSERKKVRFGLKNNKTMEFRKMDQSSRVSAASQSRVPFDPKRTPKSSVLKSPSSSPAVTKRATAADFF